MPDDISSFLGINPDAPEPPSPMIPARSDFAATLCRRYSDAYTEAHAVVTIGKVIKGVAVLLIVVGLVGGIPRLIDGRGNEWMVIGLPLVIAAILGIPIYIMGILVKSHGQSQLAELDTAVNCSRHLKDDDVQQILSKRFSL